MSIETMTKLATVTVGAGGSSSIDFTNIPQTYTDLKVVWSCRVSDNESLHYGPIFVTVNNSTGSIYDNRRVNAYGTTVQTYSDTNQANLYLAVAGSSATSSTFNNGEFYFPNYTSANYKSFSFDSTIETNNSTNNLSTLYAGLIKTTAPITSIKFIPNTSQTIVQHSTITLYGIKNARKSAGNSIKATGGNISFDGTYVVHTFNTSGTFTPTAALSVDYLVVAGGASGGILGGGGAGGYRTGNNFSVTATPYTVTVGAGGSGAGVTATGNSGTSSIFSSITSAGGGGGAGEVALPSSGGSGGGGGGSATSRSGGAGNTPSTSPSQGNNGGNGTDNGAGTNFAGGGGGGSGSIGTNGSNDNIAGNGGNGTVSSISGSSVTYAGGGGGGAYILSGTGTSGTGGTGGAGNGGKNGTSATNATPNTGSGGGGRGYTSGGSGQGSGAGSGGSGIVIIRYKA